MLTEDYTVRLDNFQGPLDLLLHLIRRAEVEITDIPIATVADQYMAHLSDIERVDIDLAGEFLVMAATLMEIKSRMLMPAEARPGDAAESGVEGAGEAAIAPDEALDPREALVRQLLEYKRSRDAAEALEERRVEWERRFPAGRADFDRDAALAVAEQAADLELDELELFDLVEAFGRIAAQVNFEALGVHHVGADDDDVPQEVHAEDILAQVRRAAAPEAAGALRFRDVFKGRTRAEMIGLFLAMLELVRRRAIGVRQDQESGEIVLSLGEGAPEPGADAPESGAASA